MMKIHVLQTGQVNISESLAFRDEEVNPSLPKLTVLSSYGRKNRKWFPVSAYLIEYDDYLILYDTGWHRDISPNGKYEKLSQIRHQTLKDYLTNQGLVPEGQAINEQLGSLNIKTSDLDYVILSHLDVDHASGLKHVGDAKKIMVSRDELDFANKNKIRYVGNMWKGVDLDTFEFEDRPHGTEEEIFENSPVGRVYDLFGDGKFQLINIPGHTPGLVALKITNTYTGKYVLLFSDGGYAEKSWREMILPGIADNLDQAIESLKWIRQTSLNENCIESLANHDPDIKPHIIEL